MTLVLHWTFDDITPTGTIPDASGHGHDTVVTAGTMQVYGPVGRGVRLDGEDGYLETAHSPELNGLQELSLSLWVRIDDPGLSRYMRLISKKRDWNYPDGYELEYNPLTNRLTFGGHGQEQLIAHDIDLDRDWHHITMTLTPSTGSTLIGKLYLDAIDLNAVLYINAGRDPKPIQELEPLIPNTAPLAVGRHAANPRRNNYLAGSVDEVRVFARALTVSEIDALVNEKHEPSDPDYDTLLPPNATRLERGAEAAVNLETLDTPVPIRDLWNPDTCPIHLLPWLAWALSVDLWNDAWPDDVKRRVVRSSAEVHRRKGTLHAVRTAIEDVYESIELREWFEYGGSPYRFRIDMPVVGDDPEAPPYDVVNEVLTQIRINKPVRSLLELFELHLSHRDTFAHTGALLASSSHVRIYPP